MPPKPQEPRPVPGSWEQWATRIVFFVVGVVMACWAPLIPLLKARMGLDEAGLGGLLLCIGIGSVIAMPFSGGLAARFGCRKTTLVTLTLASLSLPILATTAHQGLLVGALLLFGASVGITDVVMNIQAVIVEKAAEKAMMSGFHGMFSVGGIVGAGGAAGLLSLGLSPLVVGLSVTLFSILLLLLSARGLLPYGSEEESPAFAFPRGSVLLIGAMCFILFLAEGSVLDWSGVLLNEVRGLDKARSGIGYAAFAAMMTLGRLSGDAIVAALGPRMILLFGGLCASLGFILTALPLAWPVAVLGFALVGLGASNVVPVMFSAAGRQTSMPSNLAIASVTTMGYAGILIGPALIGFTARASSLPIALLLVAALLVWVATSARSATQAH